jgi:putative spermidine/putrescine transport system ATP-binding protein
VSLVQFANVGKSYDGATFAVRDLDLEVREGEFLTLLGPSGSGKTTTLMMLAGFEAPTSGDILLRGKSITRVPPHKRNFGVVFQNYALFPHLNVIDNVAFPLSVRGIGKREALDKAGRALDLVRLREFAARRPNQLSGGQQQRTALARVLVFEPVLVLMDEPFGALDKKLREQMQIEVKEIHDRLGNTMISVTHDQAEALTMSDRIAVFNDGRLQQVATPETLYERPCTSFVARFIGETNALDGTVESISDGECAVILDTGERVIATPTAATNRGGRTSLSLRPERLSIGSAEEESNCFAGRISDVIYSGDHVRYLIAIFGRDDWVIKLPHRGESERFRRGDAVEVSWHARDCLALDAVGPAAAGAGM